MLGARLQQTRRVIGNLGGPVGLGNDGSHNGAIIGQLHRRGRHRTGGSILDDGRDHRARGNRGGANGGLEQRQVSRSGRRDLAVGLHTAVSIDQNATVRIAHGSGEPSAVGPAAAFFINQAEGINTGLSHGEFEDAVGGAAAAVVFTEHEGRGLVAGLFAHGDTEAVVGVNDHAVGARLQLEPGHDFHGDVVSARFEARNAGEALASRTGLLIVDSGRFSERAVCVEGRSGEIDGVGVGLTRLDVDQRASQLRLSAGVAVGQTAGGGGGLLHHDRKAAVGGRGSAQRVGELRRDGGGRLKTKGPQQGAQGETFDVLWTHGGYGLCLV